MSKYDPLARFLGKARNKPVSLSFAEVEAILGFPLPASARRHAAWWSNNAGSHAQAHAWLSESYATERVDLAAEKVVFRTQAEPDAPSPVPQAHAGRPPRAALFGSMQGTTIVMPGVDLAQPTAPEWGRLDD